VAIQNPYTPGQILSIAVNNVRKPGLYSEDCREWDRKATGAKDLASFKNHFARAFKKIRKLTQISQNGGYVVNVIDAFSEI